jgi:hypothetical protein
VAKFGTLYLWESDAFRVAALHNVPPELANIRRCEGSVSGATQIIR